MTHDPNARQFPPPPDYTGPGVAVDLPPNQHDTGSRQHLPTQQDGYPSAAQPAAPGMQRPYTGPQAVVGPPAGAISAPPRDAMPAGPPPAAAAPAGPPVPNRSDELLAGSGRTIYEFTGDAASTGGANRNTFYGEGEVDFNVAETRQDSNLSGGGGGKWVAILIGILAVGGLTALLISSGGEDAPAEDPAATGAPAEPGMAAASGAPAAATGAAAGTGTPAATGGTGTPEAKAEAKSEPEAKAEPKAEAKPEAKPEPAAETKKTTSTTTKKKSTSTKKKAPAPAPTTDSSSDEKPAVKPVVIKPKALDDLPAPD